METITIIIALIFVVFGVLQIILFFKMWGMTNDVRKIYKQNETLLSVITNHFNFQKECYNKSKAESPVTMPVPKSSPITHKEVDDITRADSPIKTSKSDTSESHSGLSADSEKIVIDFILKESIPSATHYLMTTHKMSLEQARKCIDRIKSYLF